MIRELNLPRPAMREDAAAYLFVCDRCREELSVITARGRLPEGWGFADVIVEREHGRRQAETLVMCPRCNLPDFLP